MTISLNTDLLSMSNNRNLVNHTSSVNKATRRLSTGIRINSAADDAAGASLSEKLNSIARGYNVANNNIQTGISKLQTFDGYLSIMTNPLMKLRELALQASNGVYSNSEREMIDRHAQELVKEIQQSSINANTDMGQELSSSIGSSHQLTREEALDAGYTDAYIITDASEFLSKISADRSGSFILTSDINMIALGTLTDSAITGIFSGTFDGNGHTISNLDINTGGAAVNNVGLFSRVSGTVKDVKLNSASINAANTIRVGSIVGFLEGTLYNSSSSGSVIGTSLAGGAVGLSHGTIQYCSSSANVTSNSQTGGLVGFSQHSASVSKSFATGTVTGDNDTGGLIGINYDLATVNNCYATGNVVGGTEDSGGLVGFNFNASIANSYATSGNVSGTTIIGALVGHEQGSTVNNCFTDNNLGVTAGISTIVDSWDEDTWEKSVDPPTIKPPGAIIYQTIARDFPIQVGIDEITEVSVKYIENANINLTQYMEINLLTQNSALNALADIDQAINAITEKRAYVGSNMRTLESIYSKNAISQENFLQSKSSIYDADMAQESANLVKEQILQQLAIGLMQQSKGLYRDLILNLL